MAPAWSYVVAHLCFHLSRKTPSLRLNVPGYLKYLEQCYKGSSHGGKFSLWWPFTKLPNFNCTSGSQGKVPSTEVQMVLCGANDELPLDALRMETVSVWGLWLSVHFIWRSLKYQKVRQIAAQINWKRCRPTKVLVIVVSPSTKSAGFSGKRTEALGNPGDRVRA